MKHQKSFLAASVLPLLALGAVCAAGWFAAGCSSTSDGGSSSGDPAADASTGDDGDAGAESDGGSDAGKGQPKDAGVDVAKTPAWVDGETGKSCADACKALGKTCAVACTDPRSCGSQDTAAPPYAGYACYYYETTSGSGSFRSNAGRALLTCSDVATTTWDHYGDNYSIGDYLGNNPVSCCCE